MERGPPFSQPPHVLTKYLCQKNVQTTSKVRFKEKLQEYLKPIKNFVENKKTGQALQFFERDQQWDQVEKEYDIFDIGYNYMKDIALQSFIFMTLNVQIV